MPAEAAEADEKRLGESSELRIVWSWRPLLEVAEKPEKPELDNVEESKNIISDWNVVEEADSIETHVCWAIAWTTCPNPASCRQRTVCALATYPAASPGSLWRSKAVGKAHCAFHPWEEPPFATWKTTLGGQYIEGGGVFGE